MDEQRRTGSTNAAAVTSLGAVPGGATAGWWTKAVQLDLEAKGVVVREMTTPLRLRKV